MANLTNSAKLIEKIGGLNVTKVGTSAPSNPVEGNLRYDTTNDVLKSYDGTNWNEVGNDAADINTKTFYLSGMDDLTNAQALVDWVSGGNDRSALIHLYTGKIYTLISTGTKREFIQLNPKISNNAGGYSYSNNSKIIFNIENGIVTSITSQYITVSPNVLATDYDYQTPYTPTYNGSPATKKYVDDSVASVDGITTTQPSNPVAGSTYYDTTNNVIKVYNGTSWEEVGGGNVIAMTQSEYDALPAATKNDGKLRIITDAPTLDIVDDTAFGASWDGDTDTAPSKNAVYDAIGNIETLLAAI